MMTPTAVQRARAWLGNWILGKTSAFSSGRIQRGDVAFMDTWHTQRTPSDDELVRSYRGTAYACANLCAQGVAATPLRLYVRTGKGQARPKCATQPVESARLTYLQSGGHLGRKILRADELEEVVDHPILTLLDQVNEQLDRYTLMELTDLYLETIGSAYWLMEREEKLGIITAIWVLQSQLVQAQFNDKGVLTGYWYGVGQRKKLYSTDKILSFHMPNLHNPYYEGWSPLRATYEKVNLQEQEDAQAQALLENRARPDVVLSPKNEQGVLNEDMSERLRRDFTRKFRRGKSGGVLMLNEQVEITPLTFSPKELQSAIMHGITKEDIANAFGVPLSMLQTKDVNRANALAGQYQLARNAILPRCRRIEERLTQRFAVLFDERLTLAFDNPVPTDQEQERAQMEALLKMGVIVIDEARAEIGKEPIEGGDVPLVEGTRKPLGQVLEPPQMPPMLAPSAPKPDEEPDEEPDEGKRLAGIYGILVSHALGEIDRPAAVELLQKARILPMEAMGYLELPTLPPPSQCCTDSNPGPYVPDWDIKAAGRGHGRRIPEGAAIKRRLQEYFREQKKETLRSFKAVVSVWTKEVFMMPANAHTFFNAGEWTQEMTSGMAPLWGVEFRDGLTSTAARLAARFGDVPTIDPLSARVTQAVEQATLEFCEATNATTSFQLQVALDKTRGELAEGLLGPENTLSALTKRVNAVFTQASTYRAERIARSEASRAVHLGQRMEARESGIVKGFRWLLSGNPCPICVDLQAQMPEIPIDGKFGDVGVGSYSSIEMPPAHPNCMCTVTEVLIDE